MRAKIECAALTVLCLCSVALGDDVAVLVGSKIREVTVYADRARVTRVGKVQLKAGQGVYAFKELPGWIDEGSIRTVLSPADAGKITDVLAEREYLAKASDKDIRKAEAAVREIADKLAVLNDEANTLLTEQKQVEQIRVFAMDRLPKEAAVREIDIEDYGKVVDFVGKRVRGIAAARREIERERRNLQPELTARQKKLNDLRQMMRLEQTTVSVTIEAGAPAATTLGLTYMLPGGTWEPAHELRAKGSNPKSVSLISYAVIRQTTGEAWRGAELHFSTQSSTKTIRIPELDALFLGSGRAAARLVGGQTDTFTEAQRRYVGQNWAYNTSRNDMSRTAWQVQALRTESNKDVFTKLQEQRGTTSHFKGKGRPTVRSDGRPVRVAIGETALASKSKILAAPEVSLNAARSIEMVNTGKQPLLPGKTHLHHDGAFLGMTELDFVAEGESFAVFLGVADKIKLSRVLDKKRSSYRGGRRVRMQVSYDNVVENLSAKSVLLTLTDRVPVSQLKEIRVYDISVDPKMKPDSQGLLKWVVTLAAKQKRRLRVEYTVEYPPEELARLQMKGAPYASKQLSSKIMKLERRLR